MKTRINAANETIEMYMYMVIDGHKLSCVQKQQIKELIPICSKNWADEAYSLIA